MTPAGDDTVRVHPLLERIAHWVNDLEILIRVASGWRIYNASPLFARKFPPDIPAKLEFKNPKHIVAIFVTNEYPGG